MLRIVVLLSGGGSIFKALRDAAADPSYPAAIVAVGADVEAPGLEYAREAGIATFVTSPHDFPDRRAWGDALLANIQGFAPDLVVSAGFMRILPENFIAAVTPNLINTHPALLPHFPGAHAVRDALAAGATETGVTVHVIDAGVDTGPVLRRAKLTVHAGESEAELHDRIKQLERPLLVETVREIARGELLLTSFSPNVILSKE